MSVKITSLRVEAFRGIGSSLFFDLSSPLTLIYAPNGTGKTTLCEAAEWLLTGQIERLSKGSSFDSDVLFSKFLNSTSFPAVEAEIRFDSGLEYVRREVNKDNETLQIKPVDGEFEVISDHAWLKLLATGIQRTNTNFNTTSSIMRRWVKGSRFLTIEALAALVDSDEDNAEKRLQVFSDILGVRHLLEAEKLFADHVSKLDERLEAIQRVVSVNEVEKNSLRDVQQGSIAGALVPDRGV